MIRKITFLLAITMLIGMTSYACKKKYKEVTMTRTPCYGSCPWYSITIKSNGQIIYNGKKFVEMEGMYEANVPEGEVKDLFNTISQMRVDTFSSSYEPQMTDVPGLNYVFTDKKGKEIKINYANFGPESLKTLGKLIDGFQDQKWHQIEVKQIEEQ